MLPSHVWRYGAVPPKTATQMEYGTPTPTVRILVGNSSAYTAGTIEALPAMKNNITDIETASCQGESFRSHVMGKCSNAAPAELTISTGLRPMRSDSLPQNGSDAMNATLPMTPAHKAAPRSILRLLAA